MYHVKDDSEYYCWTEEKCKELIREYKKRQLLWDSRIPEFYSQPKRLEAWKSIDDIFETCQYGCKHKMGVLLASFRRERAKLKNALSSGKTFKSSWFGFGEFNFLMGKEGVKNTPSRKNKNGTSSSSKKVIETEIDGTNNTIICETPSNTTSNETYTFSIPIDSENMVKLEIDSDSETDEVNEENQCVQTTNPESSPVWSQSVLSELMSQSDRDETILTYAPVSETKSVHTSTDEENFEEIINFTKFIESKMKKYSARTLTAVQKDICDVLFRADMNQYENNPISTEGNRSCDEIQPTSSKRRRTLLTKEN